ncbi:MAG: filamentous hemagglutinin N-terminal domain-containing protein, partial [Waterburya sp.]
MYQTFSSLVQILISVLSCLSATTTFAQVIPDNTLDTQVGANGNISEITGGQTRGGNLFHSFQDFSVQTGTEAFFNNANNISNIFSRVTGGSISQID